ASSDLDILVDREPGLGLRAIARRLSARLGRPVQLIALRDAEQAPLLLAEIVRDGRVLVDRNGLWPRLLRSRSRIAREASRERRRIDAELAVAFGAIAS